MVKVLNHYLGLGNLSYLLGLVRDFNQQSFGAGWTPLKVDASLSDSIGSVFARRIEDGSTELALKSGSHFANVILQEKELIFGGRKIMLGFAIRQIDPGTNQTLDEKTAEDLSVQAQLALMFEWTKVNRDRP
ncbi:MAG: hypothetical protein NZT61_04925, partial [Deltaproteobacteria bacterium]|nr:hypothetical protein [Deltaproteobacteria bacterium]